MIKDGYVVFFFRKRFAQVKSDFSGSDYYDFQFRSLKFETIY